MDPCTPPACLNKEEGRRRPPPLLRKRRVGPLFYDKANHHAAHRQLSDTCPSCQEPSSPGGWYCGNGSCYDVLFNQEKIQRLERQEKEAEEEETKESTQKKRKKVLFDSTLVFIPVPPSLIDDPNNGTLSSCSSSSSSSSSSSLLLLSLEKRQEMTRFLAWANCPCSLSHIRVAVLPFSANEKKTEDCIFFSLRHMVQNERIPIQGAFGSSTKEREFYLACSGVTSTTVSDACPETWLDNLLSYGTIPRQMKNKMDMNPTELWVKTYTRVAARKTPSDFILRK